MFEKIKNLGNVYHVNVYYTVEADNFFGEDFVDVVDEIFTADEDGADAIMKHYIDLYKDHKGYTVVVTEMMDNHNHEGHYTIK